MDAVVALAVPVAKNRWNESMSNFSIKATASTSAPERSQQRAVPLFLMLTTVRRT